MRTTIDLPDPLLKHLKARAALEGRSLRDLVVQLVEKGLSTRESVDPQQRFLARPLIGLGTSCGLPMPLMSNARLQDIVNEEDDERARQLMEGR